MKKWAVTLLAIAACRSSDASLSEPVQVVPVDERLRPAFGEVVSLAESPPPISGGTLAVSKTTRVAVAADPDRDRIYVVDLSLRAVRHTIQLAPKSEPGRVALDEAGHAFVALRRTGEVATIDLATGTHALQFACVAPRGVAWDPWKTRVIVACANGQIVALPPLGGVPTTIGERLDLDLRDVVVHETSLDVSRFRSASIHSRSGDRSTILRLPGASVAWRMRGLDDRLNLIVSQATSAAEVRTTPGGYAVDVDGCPGPNSIVSTRVWLAQRNCEIDIDRCTSSVRLPSAVLPVDVATNGREVAVLAAGNAYTAALPQLFVINVRDFRGLGNRECKTPLRTGNVANGQAVAADYSSLDELVVQTREPPALHLMTDDRLRTYKTIDLGGPPVTDTGHSLFHANTGGMIACASCHPEGSDDGHVWYFDHLGPRRTPSLLGTTLHTEPLGWGGETVDFPALVDRVFVEQMSGPPLGPAEVAALQKYVGNLPAPAALRASTDVNPRGRALFENKCASCHAGAAKTNNQTIDVGTGGAFQVPSLVGVAWRDSWMHNGCADSLLSPFGEACGGAHHATMLEFEQAFVAEYLESL